jgi:hypothetical protein
MRFSAAITLPLPLRMPASEPVQRSSVEPAQPQPAQPQPAQRELPQELDQRVRELGEW